MKRPTIIFAAAAFWICACVISGCQKEAIGPEPDQIVGVWHTTKIEFVSREGMGTVEVGTSGWKGTLTLNADRTGVLLMEPKDSDSWQWAGAWEIDGDLFRIGGQGADIKLERGSLKLSGFDAVYDFNNDGTNDRAKLNLTLVK